VFSGLKESGVVYKRGHSTYDTSVQSNSVSCVLLRDAVQFHACAWACFVCTY